MSQTTNQPGTRRDHPLVAIVQQAFGWTPEEVDQLFVDADVVDKV